MNKHNMTITIEVDTNKAQDENKAINKLSSMLEFPINGAWQTTQNMIILGAMEYVRSFYNNQSDKVVFSNKREQGSILYILAVLPIFCFMLLFVWLLLGMINHDPNAIMVLGWLEWAFGG